MGPREGAAESVDCFCGTDAFDVAQTPVEDADAAEGTGYDACALYDEDFSGGDLPGLFVSG
jgi:hypothetical protein